MGWDLSGIQVQPLSDITSGAPRVLDEEVDDARLAVGLTATRSGAPIARAPRGRTAHRASRGGRSRPAVVGGDRLLLLLDVFERPPRTLNELISVALVGGYLGREALDEHDLGVTSWNVG
jgi:hypothetical protein